MPNTLFDFFIQWHITEQCNLRCRHCYQNEGMTALSLEKLKEAVIDIAGTFQSWAAEYQVETLPSFHITGGEPFVREDCLDIITFLRQRGYPVALMSNGTLITGDIARKLAGLGVQEVQVSIEGTEPVHDAIRGAGSYRRALEGLRHLRGSGVPASINLTLSRLNMGELDTLVDIAAEEGITAVTVSRLVACGRGTELGVEMLTPEELADCYRRIQEQLNGRGVAVTSGDPLMTVAGMDGDVPDSDFPLGGCAAGVFGVTITADGGVMPCRRMDLTIGNILETPFRTLWVTSPVLRALRERGDYSGACADCVYWPVCRGCRAIALAYARAQGREDYLGPDPQCPYFRARAATS